MNCPLRSGKKIFDILKRIFLAQNPVGFTGLLPGTPSWLAQKVKLTWLSKISNSL
jgi:hypothetical protein